MCENEDASSEPDIVQDRAFDFNQQANRPIYKSKNNGKSTEKSHYKVLLNWFFKSTKFRKKKK